MAHPTDDQGELLQVVDQDDRPVAARTRAECHADRELIHRSVFVIVETSAGRLYQRRGFGKDSEPGGWDLSCAGHVVAGETYEDAARRELAEEVGIDASALERIATCLIRDERESEMTTIFRVHHDGPFTVRPPEVIGLVVFAPGTAPSPLTPSSLRVLEALEAHGAHEAFTGSPSPA